MAGFLITVLSLLCGALVLEGDFSKPGAVSAMLALVRRRP